MTVAFVGLGSNAKDARGHLEAALVGFDRDPARVAACARPRWTRFEGAQAPDVLNTVAELRVQGGARELLDHLQALEAQAGRDRSGAIRTLDLDLLAFGDQRIDEPGLCVPHPRALERTFVLGPWTEIAPHFLVVDEGGRAHPVIRWRASLESIPGNTFDHRMEESLSFADRSGAVEVLPDRAALARWRASRSGPVGVVPTMGALHAGHGSLAQRAAAECEHVVATIFVNPLQFAPGEDLGRYPRTFDEDCALLSRHGVDAVYAPAPDDLYPVDFSTHVVPRAMADVYEGAQRPTHFEGVTTIVTKLLNRVRPDHAYFARKDAQQLAILQRLHRDLDLPGTIRTCATVHEASGLARSSRNRYLSEAQHAQALGLSFALRAMRNAASEGWAIDQIREVGRLALKRYELRADYVDVVDPRSFEPSESLGATPALAVGAVRVGETRLLDNRWIARPVDSGGASGDGPVPAS